MADPVNGNGDVVPASGRGAGGRFAPGNRIKGAGRKKGSRSKLSESFLADLHASWRKHGAKALDRVAQTEPAAFLRCVTSILPKALEVDGVIGITHRSEFAIELQDFRTAYQKYGEIIGATPRAIEHIADAPMPIESDDDPQSE